jgi:predicted RNase H-like nuclease (RuvC/YqgF family)
VTVLVGLMMAGAITSNPTEVIIAIVIGGGGIGSLAAIFLVRSGQRSNNANASGQISEAWNKLFEPYRKQIADLETNMKQLKEHVNELEATNNRQRENIANQATNIKSQAETISKQEANIQSQARNIAAQARAIIRQNNRIEILERALEAAGRPVPTDFAETETMEDLNGYTDGGDDDDIPPKRVNLVRGDQ